MCVLEFVFACRTDPWLIQSDRLIFSEKETKLGIKVIVVLPT